MALDPYAPCPCGSGKKFKWCCQPIYGEIEKAFQLEQNGQHELALQTMDEVIARHSSNPEAYGRKAILLYAHNRLDEAEAALDKAFQLNPQYPFGYYLRGRFRMGEGELVGALMMFRKATEYYDPEAHGPLADLYGSIAECELHLNRPIASRSALQLALKHDPTSEDFRKAMEAMFGKEARLPELAKKEYTYKSPPATASDAHKKAWQKALNLCLTGKLIDALKAFEHLTSSEPSDGPAWYNLALTKAWLGDNQGALQALDHYISCERDELQAGEAWAMGEVLRFGYGLEKTEADYVEYSRTYQFQDIRKVETLLKNLVDAKRLIVLPSKQEGILAGILTESPQVVTVGPTTKPLRFGAHFVLATGNFVLQIRGTDREKVTNLGHELETQSQGTLSNPSGGVNFANLTDPILEAMVFPVDAKSEEEANPLVEEGAARYFEEAWIHRPLNSLSGVPPLDAIGSFNLRKKLVGVVRFLEDCGKVSQNKYDFDRLRRKLGLLDSSPGSTTTEDVSAMGAAELAGLDVNSLSERELEQAFQTARKLDAKDLAVSFLKALVNRPPQKDKTDRYSWYNQLIQISLEQNDTDAALEQVDVGEKYDCEHNEGRRRNDYELWRGRIQAKRGEVEPAQDVFERLIARDPAEMKYRSTAAESMLSSKQPQAALRFAEGGLEQARKQQNRDSEGHFLELIEAAKKQVA